MLLNYQQTKVKAGGIRKYQAILPNKREETIIAQKTKKSSSDKAQKIQWHPAFYAAAELELKENIEELDLISEYHLSKEPIRIDLLIIKEENADKVMKNEIGHIMRKYNVLEYKGPGDELSIDTLYKTLGYACLYKGYGKTINEIPADELTVSLFREAYPQKLFWELERKGYVLREREHFIPSADCGDQQVEPDYAQQPKNLICKCRYRGYQEVLRTNGKHEDTARAE